MVVVVVVELWEVIAGCVFAVLPNFVPLASNSAAKAEADTDVSIVEPVSLTGDCFVLLAIDSVVARLVVLVTFMVVSVCFVGPKYKC